MRQKRAKSYRKQLLVYNHTFKFRAPYQVLVDNQIVLDCSNSNYDLAKGLKNTLQSEVKVMITQCCMQALYEENNQDAIELARRFERRRCNHNPKEPKTAIECIESVVNINGQNKHRYVVASQDLATRRKLRQVPGVPLIHISRAVMIMEPLSDVSAQVSRRKENEKLYKGLNDPKFTGVKSAVDKETVKEKESTDQQKKKRKIGPKGPNPLSMKKKKTASNSMNENIKNREGHNDANIDDSKKKRRRKHKSKTGTEIENKDKDAAEGANSE
ncbi:rRNA-binding ribosome biosynthesis protein UTP23 NDAI_0I02250 [Naumovozyma dairenensis CBS 421]|uniref:U three protein 23 n=1 Tax=Naumovozyma dairenensis (strain ATCC 10597 / BCRC 20456 / CBS 421 / NBRC 0211 / NRRL Y-12639) TaxID=1071378 RepID=G0WG83_NAUDC|nr:hypothetical protein NDAI_0I02250 [Naumovozyma dairenensis CBS 421]CCD26794.1 hypothetical protein NDAI_0I02250 [Naumovozyma dairenensis CBS 421]